MEKECKYQELNRRLKEKFTNGLNDDGIMVKSMREFTSIGDTGLVTIAQVPAWVSRKETQRAQTTMLDSLKETKEFNAIRLPKTEPL